MQGNSILAKLVIFHAFTEFGQVDMFEWPDGEANLLGREGNSAGEDRRFLAQGRMVVNLG